MKPGDATEAAAKANSFLFLNVDSVLNTSSLMAGGAKVHSKLMKCLAAIVTDKSTW